MIIYLKLLLTAFFWGETFIAGRVVVVNAGPFSAAFLRFGIASVFLGLFVWRNNGNLPRLTLKQWVSVVCLGMTGVFAYNVFFFKGLGLIEAGRADGVTAYRHAVRLYGNIFDKPTGFLMDSNRTIN